jgi:hypothetical protein
MMRVRKKPLRDDAHQFVLDLARRFARRDVEPVGETKDMGVDRERRLAEGGVEHYVRCLAPDAGQRLERFAVPRRLAAVLINDRPRKRDDVLGLSPIEPDRLDPFGEPLDVQEPVAREAQGRALELAVLVCYFKDGKARATTRE